MLRHVTRTLGPVALLLLAACATGRKAGNRHPGQDIVLVEVHNDLTPPADLTVRMISGNGITTVLGGVGPNRIVVLQFRDPGLTGEYRLRADGSGNRSVESRDFTLFQNALVVWSLQDNTITVSTRSESDLLGASHDADGNTP
ncbi:MAG: hypothetical protein P8099_06500 [Gemmatimonadota bacterium]